MAIDPNSQHQPNKVRPAREHAPAGLVNASQAASGGQVEQPGDVKPTPSMRPTHSSGGTWRGPSGASAGDPPAD